MVGFSVMVQAISRTTNAALFTAMVLLTVLVMDQLPSTSLIHEDD